MKLTVLLICYNQGGFIKECVESILFQELPFETELVVADDSSTDNTLKIIKELTEKSDLSIRFLESDVNIGMLKNYERAFSECRGEYIAIIEGDDYWTHTRRLKKHVEFLEVHRECSMSFNRIIFKKEEKNLFQVKEWENREDYEYITTQELTYGNKIGNLSACVIRKAAYDKLKPGLFEMPVADWMIAMALGQYGVIAKLKEPMSVYRIHKKGLSKNSDNLFDKNLESIIDQYDSYLEYRFHEQFSRFKLKTKLKKAGCPDNVAHFITSVYFRYKKLVFGAQK